MEQILQMSGKRIVYSAEKIGSSYWKKKKGIWFLLYNLHKNKFYVDYITENKGEKLEND